MSLDVRPTDDPIVAMRRWYDDAQRTLARDEAHTVVLATVSAEGLPSARVVLCRSIEADGALRFYTNYRSRKGRDLEATGRAAMVFLWRSAGRQMRVQGTVVRTSDEVSDAYWSSRPRLSQLSALASPQSEVIADPDGLERERVRLEQEYEGATIPRPGWWGGYQVIPTRIEFWLQGDARLHERVAFEPEGDRWRGRYLAP